MSDDYERRQAQAEDDGEYILPDHFVLVLFRRPNLVHSFFAPLLPLKFAGSKLHTFSLNGPAPVAVLHDIRI